MQFSCSIDKAKNWLKTLKRNGLIKIEYNQQVNQNVITIEAVNPEPGTRYVQMQVPDDKVEEIYTNRCKYLTNIYMYLTLHARKKDGTSFLSDGDIHRGELVETLHRIASICGCCVKTVSNVLSNLKKKGLVAFETIKSVAMKVKLLLYPVLKATVNKVSKAAIIFTEEATVNDNSALENKVDIISMPEKMAQTEEEKIIDTPVSKDVKYLLFERKKNNKVSTLNNVIAEVDKAVVSLHFPIERLREAFDVLYKKNKENGDNQITAKVIITFLSDYKKKLVAEENEQRISREKEQEFLKQKAIKEKELSELKTSWQLVAKAEKEVKDKGQIHSFREDEISRMYYLLNIDGINGYTLLERGQILLFVKDKLLANDGYERPATWKEDVIAQAILLERLLGKKEVSQKAIEEAYLKDKKEKNASLQKFIDAYEMEKKARNTGQH